MLVVRRVKYYNYYETDLMNMTSYQSYDFFYKKWDCIISIGRFSKFNYLLDLNRDSLI